MSIDSVLASRSGVRAAGMPHAHVILYACSKQHAGRCRRRDEANQQWSRTEVTRFPHAVLEVKLSLPEGESEPKWVTDLVGGTSGLCAEVHKFSKFIQGTATLFPRDVQVSSSNAADACVLWSCMRLEQGLCVHVCDRRLSMNAVDPSAVLSRINCNIFGQESYCADLPCGESTQGHVQCACLSSSQLVFYPGCSVLD